MKDYEYFKGQPKKERAAGYCFSYSHRGYLSVKNIKKHKCLEKNCHWFIKFNQHPHWAKQEKINDDKRLKKHIKQNEEVIKTGTVNEIADLFEKLFKERWENE